MATKKTTTTTKTIKHTVVKGDTLWSLAQKYLGSGTKYKQIASENNIKDANSINVGQVLKITTTSSKTTETTTKTKYEYYTVKSGDTLSAIARKYYDDESKYTDIATLNNLANPHLIYVGQVLKIKISSEPKTKKVAKSKAEKVAAKTVATVSLLGLVDIKGKLKEETTVDPNKPDATLFIEWDTYLYEGEKRAAVSINGFKPFGTVCCIEDWKLVIEYLKGCPNIKATKVEMTKDELKYAKSKSITKLYCRPNPTAKNVIAEFETNRFNIISRSDFYYLWCIFGSGNTPKAAEDGERFAGFGGVSEEKRKIFKTNKKGDNAKVIPMVYLDTFKYYDSNAPKFAKNPIAKPMIVMQRYNNKYAAEVEYNKKIEEAKAKYDADVAEAEAKIQEINETLEKDIAEAKKDAKKQEAKIKAAQEKQQAADVKKAKSVEKEKLAKTTSTLTKAEKKKLIKQAADNAKAESKAETSTLLSENKSKLNSTIDKLKANAKSDINAVNGSLKSLSSYFSGITLSKTTANADGTSSTTPKVITRVGWFGETISDIVNSDLEYEKLYGSIKQFQELNWGDLDYRYVYDTTYETDHDEPVKTPKTFIEYTDHSLGKNSNKWSYFYDDEVLFFPYATIGFRLSKNTADRIKWLLGKFGEYVKTYQYSYKTGEFAPFLYINPMYVDENEATMRRPKLYTDENGTDFIQLKRVLTAGDSNIATVSTVQTMPIYDDKATTANVIANIPWDDDVEIISYDKTWCKVKYDNVTGYSLTAHLDFGILDTNLFTSLDYYENQLESDVRELLEILGTSFVSIESLNVVEPYDYREGDWKPDEIPVQADIPPELQDNTNTTDASQEVSAPGADAQENLTALTQVLSERVMDIPLSLEAWLFGLVYDVGSEIDYPSADNVKIYKTRYFVDLDSEDECYTLFNESWERTSEPYFGPLLEGTDISAYSEKKYLRVLSHFYEDMLITTPLIAGFNPAWYGEFWINRKLVNCYEIPSIGLDYDMNDIFQICYDLIDNYKTISASAKNHTEDYLNLYPNVKEEGDEADRKIAELESYLEYYHDKIKFKKCILDACGTYYIEAKHDSDFITVNFEMIKRGELIEMGWYDTTIELYPYELLALPESANISDDSLVDVSKWTSMEYSDYRIFPVPVYITNILTGENVLRYAEEVSTASDTTTNTNTTEETANTDLAAYLSENMGTVVSIVYTEQIYTSLFLNQSANLDKKIRLEKAREEFLRLTEIKNLIYEEPSDIWNPFVEYVRVKEEIQTKIPAIMDELRDAEGYTQEYLNGLINHEVLYHTGMDRYYMRDGINGFYVYMDQACTQAVSNGETFHVTESNISSLLPDMIVVVKSEKGQLLERFENEKSTIVDMMLIELSLYYIALIPEDVILCGWKMRYTKLDTLMLYYSRETDETTKAELLTEIKEMLDLMLTEPSEFFKINAYIESYWVRHPSWYVYKEYNDDGELVDMNAIDYTKEFIRYNHHPEFANYNPVEYLNVDKSYIGYALTVPVDNGYVEIVEVDETTGVITKEYLKVPLYHATIGDWYPDTISETDVIYPRDYHMDVMEYVEQCIMHDPSIVYTKAIWKNGIIANERLMVTTPVYAGADHAYENVIDDEPELYTTRNLIMKKDTIGFDWLMISGYEFEWLDLSMYSDLHEDLSTENTLIDQITSQILLSNRTYPYCYGTDYGKLLNSDFLEEEIDEIHVDSSEGILVYDSDYYYEKMCGEPIVFDGSTRIVHDFYQVESDITLPECAEPVEYPIYNFYEWDVSEFVEYDYVQWKPIYQIVHHTLLLKDGEVVSQT